MSWDLIYVNIFWLVFALQSEVLQGFYRAHSIVFKVFSTMFLFGREVQESWVASDFIIFTEILAIFSSAVNFTDI